MVTLNNQTSVV